MSPEPAARIKTLSDLNPGTTALIGELDMDESDSVRLMELGFIPGTPVSCQRRVPLGDLAVYQLDGAQIAVRRETASRIRIRSVQASGTADA